MPAEGRRQIIQEGRRSDCRLFPYRVSGEPGASMQALGSPALIPGTGIKTGPEHDAQVLCHTCQGLPLAEYIGGALHIAPDADTIPLAILDSLEGDFVRGPADIPRLGVFPNPAGPWIIPFQLDIEFGVVPSIFFRGEIDQNIFAVAVLGNIDIVRNLIVGRRLEAGGPVVDGRAVKRNHVLYVDLGAPAFRYILLIQLVLAGTLREQGSGGKETDCHSDDGDTFHPFTCKQQKFPPFSTYRIITSRM